MSFAIRPLSALLILSLGGCEFIERTVIQDDGLWLPEPGTTSHNGQGDYGPVNPWTDADTSDPIDTGAGTGEGSGTGGSGGGSGGSDTAGPTEPLGHGGFVALVEYFAPCGACFSDPSGYRLTAQARINTPQADPEFSMWTTSDTCFDMGAGDWASRAGPTGGLDAGTQVTLGATGSHPLPLARYESTTGGHLYGAAGGLEAYVGPGQILDATLSGGSDVGVHTLPGVLTTQAPLTDLSPSSILQSDHAQAFGPLHPGATLTWNPIGQADLIEVAIFIYEPSGSYPLDHVVVCHGPDDGSLDLPESSFSAFENHLAAVQVARISVAEQRATWEDVVVQGVSVTTSVGTATIDSVCGVGAPCPPPSARTETPRLQLPVGSNPVHRLTW